MREPLLPSRAAFLALGALLLACPALPAAPKEGPALPVWSRGRALIISAHEYRYANPVGGSRADADGPAGLARALTDGLDIPADQVAHLSDEARARPGPPTREAVRKALADFLTTCRAEDHALVVFVGHAVTIDKDAYLVPLDGDFEDRATLLSLKSVLEQMARCPAGQKVLVLDVHRHNAGRGTKRPAAGPMSRELDELLKRPPAGVQVWSACVAGQYSHETDDAPAGVFLRHLRRAVLARRGADRSFPLAALSEAVNRTMKVDLERRKLTQTARVSAAAVAEEVPRPVKLPVRPPVDPAVRAVLEEISVPPLGRDRPLRAELFPPPRPAAMKGHEATERMSPLREAVRKARVTLWALTPGEPPAALAGPVADMRKNLGADLTVLRDRYEAPAPGADEIRFKERVKNDSKEMSRLVFFLEQAMDDLKEVEGERAKETKRWQANYDFIKARIHAQLAYLEEYQGLLGRMRGELPPLDRALYKGWQLASTNNLQTRFSKSLVKTAKSTFAKLTKEHPGTPWEVLARRELLTAVGLEWRPAE
jgi:hypothetical protein